MTMSAKKHDHEISKRNRQGVDDAIEEKTCEKIKQLFTCEEDVEQREKRRLQKSSMTINTMKEI